MPGDREKSLDRGATDYVTKPVDIDQLLDDCMRWLCQSGEEPVTGDSGAAPRPRRRGRTDAESCSSTTGRRTCSRWRRSSARSTRRWSAPSSGEEALKALLRHDFAVILLDVQMPGMDGFETAAHIKRLERTKDMPIIFLTAINREPEHAFRGYSAGAVDYLAKPFDPWVLRAKVEVFVELYRKNRQLGEQAALLADQVAGLGDPEVVEDVARHMAEVEASLDGDGG